MILLIINQIIPTMYELHDFSNVIIDTRFKMFSRPSYVEAAKKNVPRDSINDADTDNL